jgi:cysteine-rich repeat protein
VLPIFTEFSGTCVRCHGAVEPAAAVILDPLFPAATLQNLVGVPSVELPEFMRVLPGFSSESYLIMKEIGDPRMLGDRMPFFPQDYFDQNPDQLALQRSWIDQGAVDDGCSAVCLSEFCGDGVLRAGTEQCDDGNGVPDDGCGPTCLIEFCGDGIVNNGVEQCDDGNTVGGDGCDPSCRNE